MIDFSPQVGTEQAGIRPGIVISHDRFNRLANNLHIVVPVTGTDRGYPHYHRIDPPEGGMTKPSFAMCDQVKSQSNQRFLKRRGQVGEETLRRIQEIVGLFIDR